MPQPPYALLRASINGGAIQTGGLVVAGSSSVQLSADPAGNASRFLWQIYGYPVGYAQPAGWFTDAGGTYYSTLNTPPPFTVGATSLFGKYMLRLVVNNGGTENNKAIPVSQLTDESTSIEVVSNSGIHATGLNETTQWGGLKKWLAHVNANWVLIDAWINGGGGGGGGGVTAHGALTGLAADDHTQYLLVNGTRAMTGALAMGAHKITGVSDPTSPQDVATKAYVDAFSPTAGGFIKADGSVAFTADQPLGNHKLTGVATPTASGDAATKGYVDAGIVKAGTNAFTGNQSMGGFKLTNVGTPTASTDVATKGYADALAGSAPVARLATAAALPTNTRSGNVLTASANGALTVDGTAVAVGDIVLVKNEVTAANDGLYVVTATGGGAAGNTVSEPSAKNLCTPPPLTRKRAALRLLRAREARGLSQEQLAAELGISKRAYGSIERGQVRAIGLEALVFLEGHGTYSSQEGASQRIHARALSLGPRVSLQTTGKERAQQREVPGPDLRLVAGVSGRGLPGVSGIGSGLSDRPSPRTGVEGLQPGRRSEAGDFGEACGSRTEQVCVSLLELPCEVARREDLDGSNRRTDSFFLQSRAARLARCVHTAKVGGSNPPSATKRRAA